MKCKNEKCGCRSVMDMFTKPKNGADTPFFPEGKLGQPGARARLVTTKTFEGLDITIDASEVFFTFTQEDGSKTVFKRQFDDLAEAISMANFLANGFRGVVEKIAKESKLPLELEIGQYYRNTVGQYIYIFGMVPTAVSKNAARRFAGVNVLNNDILSYDQNGRTNLHPSPFDLICKSKAPVEKD